MLLSPLRSAIAPALRPGLGNPFGPSTSLRWLFGDKLGLWSDPAHTGLTFQDTALTTGSYQSNAVGARVNKAADPYRYGEELWTNTLLEIDPNTYATTYDSATQTIAQPDAQGASTRPRFKFAVATEQGKYYRVRGQFKGEYQTADVTVYLADTTANSDSNISEVMVNADGTFSYVRYASAGGHLFINTNGTAGPWEFSFDLSVREVKLPERLGPSGEVLPGELTGPEKVANGLFPESTAGWTADDATLSVVDGRLQVDTTVDLGRAVQGIAVEAGKSYWVSGEVFPVSGSNLTALQFSSQANGGGAAVGEYSLGSGARTIGFQWTAPATQTYYLIAQNNSTDANAVNQFDNISVREIFCPERVKNGGVDNDVSNWSKDENTTISWSAGRLRAELSANNNPRAFQQIDGFVEGQWYRLKGSVFKGTVSGNIYLRVSSSSGFSTSVISEKISGTDIVDGELLFKATATTLYVGGVAISSTLGEYFELDDFTLRPLGLIPSQPTTAAKPTLAREPVGGRSNDLQHTEDFANAYWTGWQGITVTSDAISGPLDGMADKFVETADLLEHRLNFSGISTLTGVRTLSVYAKAAERDRIALMLGSSFAGAWFDLSTAAHGGLDSYSAGLLASDMEAVGDGWYRCSIKVEVTSSPVLQVYIRNSGNTTAGQYTGDGSSGVYVTGIQNNPGDLTPYQRVRDQYDVFEAGQRHLYTDRFKTDDYLDTGVSSIDGATLNCEASDQWLAGIVFETTEGASQALFSKTGTSATTLLAELVNGAYLSVTAHGSSTNLDADLNPAGDKNVLLLNWDGTELTGMLNGLNPQTLAVGAEAATTATILLGVMRASADGALTSYYSGDLGQFIVRPQAYSLPERRRLMVSLSRDYGTRQGYIWDILNLFANGEKGLVLDIDPDYVYQDSAGTTPGEVGQPVGLVLDRSQGLVLGSELWVSPTLGTCWTDNGDGSYTLNDPSSTYDELRINDPTPGRAYQIEFDYQVISGALTFRLDDVVQGSVLTGSGSITLRVRADASTNTKISFVRGTTVEANEFTVSNISVRELPGHHATQTTATARPILGRHPVTGIRNLLTYTEQFDNGAWSNPGSRLTISGDLLEVNENADNTSPGYVLQSPAVEASTTAYQVEAKAGASDFIAVQHYDGSSYGYSYFNLATGASLTQGVGVATSSITALADGWYRIELTINNTGTVGRFGIVVANGDNDRSSVAGNSIRARKPQYENATTATDYQKVVSQYDVTEAGVEDLYYLKFNGVDSYLVTPSIDFTGTDKMSVFAGVYKASDASSMAVVTHSYASNGFGLFFPISTTGSSGFGSAGSTNSVAATTISAPSKKVLSGFGDISGDLAIFRADGVEQIRNTSDQGTGTYSNVAMGIGAKSDGSNWRLDGRLYSLAVAGKLASDAEIARAEHFVAKKTGKNL